MSDDLRFEQNTPAADDTVEDYAAPALTDLGSFAELTQLSTGPNPDLEGTS